MHYNIMFYISDLRLSDDVLTRVHNLFSLCTLGVDVAMEHKAGGVLSYDSVSSEFFNIK